VRQKIIIIVISVLLLAFAWAGAVYAQEEPGYPIDEPDPELPSETINPVCDGIREHPVLSGISIRYGVSYEELLGYYCDLGMGVGDIALALATAQYADGQTSLEVLLSQRVDDSVGWGDIWLELGMVGWAGERGATNPAANGLIKNNQRNQFQEMVQNQNEFQEQNMEKPENIPGLTGEGPGNSDEMPGQAGQGSAGQENSNRPVTPPGQQNNPGKGNRP